MIFCFYFQEKNLEIAVVQIIEDAGVDDYIPTFARHRITIETLQQMSDDDFKQVSKQLILWSGLIHNTVSFLPNPHNIHPIARPWGWGMRGLLWVGSLIDVLLLSSYCGWWYCNELDRVTMALTCIDAWTKWGTFCRKHFSNTIPSMKVYVF